MKTSHVIIVFALAFMILGFLLFAISPPRSEIEVGQDLWMKAFDLYLKGVMDRSEYKRIWNHYIEIEDSRPYVSTGTISILLGSAILVVSLTFNWLSSKIEDDNLII